MVILFSKRIPLKDQEGMRANTLSPNLRKELALKQKVCTCRLMYLTYLTKNQKYINLKYNPLREKFGNISKNLV